MATSLAVEALGHLEELFEDRPKWGAELVAAEWLLSHAWNDFDKLNLMLRGFSFRCSQQGTLLTVRAQDGARAVVSFVSGVYASDCVRIFYRLWCTDSVKWSDDKFA